MKNLALVSSFLLSGLFVACGGKAPPAAPEPAPVEKTEAPKAEAPKAEEKPAEAKPEEAKPAEAKPAEVAGGADKPADGAVPAAAKDWEVFEDTAGTFSIRAPGKPQTVPQEAETDLGKVTYTNHMFNIPDGMLMVAWADLPLDPKDINKDVETKMFDGGRDGMMKAIKATLVKEETITLDGFPGRAYLMQLEVPGYGTAQNHVRTFLAGNRHYTLQGLGMGTGAKEKQLAFLDTFHITKKADAPTAGAAPAPTEAAPTPAPGDAPAPAPAPGEAPAPK